MMPEVGRYCNSEMQYAGPGAMKVGGELERHFCTVLGVITWGDEPGPTVRNDKTAEGSAV
ncbi:MAG: hypothetical protein JWM42_176 [Burkholderia sp.]|nr:hypothetical protein [Burkholderia sp.]